MTIGVVMAAVLPNILKRPPLSPAISLGEVSETTAQPSAPMPLPKKRERHDGDHEPFGADVIADDHRHGQQHAGDDGQFAGER